MSSSNSSKAEGNTISSAPAKKQVSCAKKWCMTLNNYTDEDLQCISSIVPNICSSYIVGMELGEKCKTPHLQCFFEFKVKCRPMSHFVDTSLGKRPHWEKCKGSKEQNFDYCSKEGKVLLCHPPIPKPIKVYDCERKWQKDVLQEILEEPDDRTITWIWSHAGGTRKTSMCKYLVVKHNAVITGGKAADVRNCICDYLKNKGHTPELLVINIPRSFNPEFVSYEAFENIKDMCFYSGKYEGGMVVGNSPHLYIFANFEPELDKMSEDRWRVINIDEPHTLTAIASGEASAGDGINGL
jgi:hypothetical protein